MEITFNTYFILSFFRFFFIHFPTTLQRGPNSSYPQYIYPLFRVLFLTIPISSLLPFTPSWVLSHSSLKFLTFSHILNQLSNSQVGPNPIRISFLDFPNSKLCTSPFEVDFSFLGSSIPNSWNGSLTQASNLERKSQTFGFNFSVFATGSVIVILASTSKVLGVTTTSIVVASAVISKDRDETTTATTAI